MHVIAVAAAEQLAHRQPGRLAKDVPARDIDPALHVRMALEGGIHRAIELAQLARVEPEQVRPQLPQARPDALGVGGQVERPERAHFPVPDDPRVGLDADDGAVEGGDRLAARPFIGAFVERQLDAVSNDARDLHNARHLTRKQSDQ